MASIIKADNIQKVSDGSNIIKKCGSTTTIGSGACSPIVICGSTVTLGRCGGTVTLASGATQTGFGRTGTVDWCTTAKTAPFTGVSGKGYFINTTCGAVTVTLPATPTAGDIISLKDYGGTWQTNNITLCNNGSLINGICSTAGLNTQNQSVTLIYVDGTKGWQDIQDSTAGVSGNAFIVATGGTITTCGDYKIHAFTSDSTFTVCSAGLPANANVDYLVVAGGAGGGSPGVSGGGGAGGYRESYCATTSGCYTASPLASATSLPVTATTYPITVGGGGAFFASGSNSIFSTITSAGGGTGGGGGCNGFPGGSGGGAGQAWPVPYTGGAGNTPPVSPPQGNPGGNGTAGPTPGTYLGSGGGGAGAAGAGVANSGAGGAGGIGTNTNLIPASYGEPGPNPGRYVAAGGGGGAFAPAGGPGAGGTGGGGNGSNSCTPAPNALTNSGSGGGGGGYGTGASNGGTGGSGLVIIRYKFQ
jgi:hypothetical protein